jgi:hypothetical protein
MTAKPLVYPSNTGRGSKGPASDLNRPDHEQCLRLRAHARVGANRRTDDARL